MMEAKGIEGGKKKDQELSNRQKSHGRVFDNTSGRDSIPKAHKANDPTSHPIHCPERIQSNPFYWRHAGHRREGGNKGVPCGA